MFQLFRNFTQVVEKTSKFWSIYHPKPDFPHIVSNDDWEL
jgi:large subunit ribosomal protein L3